jgi:hypothetical protein
MKDPVTVGGQSQLLPRIARDGSVDKESRAWLQERLGDANWLIKAGPGKDNSRFPPRS